MKLKVQCDSCSRVHLITVKEQKEVMEITCLNCEKKILYRIPEKKLNDKDKNAFETLMGMFGMRK